MSQLERGLFYLRQMKKSHELTQEKGKSSAFKAKEEKNFNNFYQDLEDMLKVYLTDKQ